MAPLTEQDKEIIRRAVQDTNNGSNTTDLEQFQKIRLDATPTPLGKSQVSGSPAQERIRGMQQDHLISWTERH